MIIKSCNFILLGLLFALSVDAQGAYNAEVISEKTECLVASNKLTISYQVLIQINNVRGHKYAKISVPYSGNHKISSLEARIEDTHGNILRNLKKKDIKDVSAFNDMTFYNDEYVKKFELIHNQFPYRIYYSYTYSYDEFLTITGWSPVYEQKIPTLNSELRVEIPKDYLVNINQQQTNINKQDSTDNTYIYYWKGSYVDVYDDDEIYASQLRSLLPYVRIDPINFKYGIEGKQNDWVGVGNWESELIDGLNDLPQSEKVKVESLTNSCHTDIDKIKALYYYLQDNTRYINVSIDIGGFKPYPASYVAQNKYGDCKALTNYMKSLLEEIGVKSFYTSIYAGNSPIEIVREFPGQQFNHVFLYIPLEKDTLFLECTSKNEPFGYISTFIQNRYALAIDKDNSRFIKVPASGIDDQKIVRKIKISGLPNNCTGIMDMKCMGEKYEGLNYFQFNLSKNEQNNNVKRYIPFKNYTINKWEIKEYYRDSAVNELHVDCELTNFSKQYGESYMQEPVLALVPNFEKPENRSFPVQINYPLYCVDSIYYSSPINYKFSYPEEFQLDSKYGKYSINYYILNNELLMVRSFILYSQYVSLDQYPEFYTFIKTLLNREAKNIIMLTKTQDDE